MADTISFYYWVSSEADYDFLIFKIDNTEKGSWSGEVGWTRAAFPVTEGLHTFTWTYKKDYMMTSGSDMAKVDLIEFPSSKTATSVEDHFMTSTIAVMPNPTTDVVRILLDDNADLGNIHYQLYDLSGRMLQQDVLTDYNSTISLSRYANGMYYLVIRDGEQILHNAKIIKQ